MENQTLQQHIASYKMREGTSKTKETANTTKQEDQVTLEPSNGNNTESENVALRQQIMDFEDKINILQAKIASLDPEQQEVPVPERKEGGDSRNLEDWEHVSPRRQKSKISKKETRAFRGENDPLSNFYGVSEQIRYKGRLFDSSEQAFQHTKACFHRLFHLAEEIRREKKPLKQKRLGDSIRESAAWKQAKVDIMYEILVEKAKRCPEFRTELERSGVTFVEAVKDYFWASGLSYQDTVNTTEGKWPGRNVMGSLLGRLCSDLHNIQTPPKYNQGKRTTKKQENSPTSEGERVSNPPLGLRNTQRQQPNTPNTPEEEKETVVFVGDSIIRKVNLKGTDIQKLIMGGATIEIISQCLEHIVGGTKIDKLVISVGSNNLSGDSMEVLRQKFCNLLKTAKEVCKEAKIVLNSIPQRKDVDERWTEEVNEMLGDISKAYETVLVKPIIYVQNNYSKDGIHLNGLGAFKMSEAINAALRADQEAHPLVPCLASQQATDNANKQPCQQDVTPEIVNSTKIQHIVNQLGPGDQENLIIQDVTPEIVNSTNIQRIVSQLGPGDQENLTIHHAPLPPIPPLPPYPIHNQLQSYLIPSLHAQTLLYPLLQPVN